mmetsp:Transcript_6866/g.20888  ORF Transcript_6866/g.20888 Transcript_6866/m.20888 type:complete len:202 (+) Transcript_6866:83-688(+)
MVLMCHVPLVQPLVNGQASTPRAERESAGMRQRQHTASLRLPLPQHHSCQSPVCSDKSAGGTRHICPRTCEASLLPVYPHHLVKTRRYSHPPSVMRRPACRTLTVESYQPFSRGPAFHPDPASQQMFVLPAGWRPQSDLGHLAHPAGPALLSPSARTSGSQRSVPCPHEAFQDQRELPRLVRVHSYSQPRRQSSSPSSAAA